MSRIPARFGYLKDKEHAMLTYMARRVPKTARKKADKLHYVDGDRGRVYWGHMSKANKLETLHHAKEIGAFVPGPKMFYATPSGAGAVAIRRYGKKGPIYESIQAPRRKKAPAKKAKAKKPRVASIAKAVSVAAPVVAVAKRVASVAKAKGAGKRMTAKGKLLQAARQVSPEIKAQANAAKLKGKKRLDFYVSHGAVVSAKKKVGKSASKGVVTVGALPTRKLTPDQERQLEQILEKFEEYSSEEEISHPGSRRETAEERKINKILQKYSSEAAGDIPQAERERRVDEILRRMHKYQSTHGYGSHEYVPEHWKFANLPKERIPEGEIPEEMWQSVRLRSVYE